MKWLAAKTMRGDCGIPAERSTRTVRQDVGSSRTETSTPRTGAISNAATTVRVASLLLAAPLAACSAGEPSQSAVAPSAAATAKLSALAAQSNSPGAKPSLADFTVISTLRNAAINAATKAGVTKPRSIRAVAASDHQVVESLLSGAVIYDHSPVFVVTMTGGPFTHISHPPGAPAPTGNVMRITVDAKSYRVTDIGLGQTEPDLSQIDSNVVDLTAP